MKTFRRNFAVISALACCINTLALGNDDKKALDFCKTIGGEIREYTYKDPAAGKDVMKLCWIGDAAAGAWTVYNFRNPRADGGRTHDAYLEFKEENNLTRPAINNFFDHLRGVRAEEENPTAAAAGKAGGSDADSEESLEVPVPTEVAMALQAALDIQAGGKNAFNGSPELSSRAPNRDNASKIVLPAKKPGAPQMVVKVPNPAFTLCSLLKGKPYAMVRKIEKQDEPLAPVRSEAPRTTVCAWPNSVIELQTLYWGAGNRRVDAFTQAILYGGVEEPKVF
ncbi:MAG: hypothetical protein HYX41_04440 [Bdellovibrio sp.]|nr:hypothetical protein [Bdellovibrio sp.]